MANFITCKYFVSHKKRNCRGLAKLPSEYCPEHSVTNESSEQKKRIICPVDNKHTVYEHKLKQHLKVCNANLPKFKSYYSERINAGSDCEGDQFVDVKLIDVGIDEIKALIVLLLNIRLNFLQNNDGIYDIHSQSIELENESNSNSFSVKRDKHTFQFVNLISHMNALKMLDLNSINQSDVFLEFGAGKGGFSHFIEKSLAEKSEKPLDNLTFILIDRKGARNRFDAKHKSGPKFERILMDISDLNLDYVDSVKDKRIFVISKHLCGTATDLTLRCLKHWFNKGCLSKAQVRERLRGITIALCCHHKCSWKSYCNKAWIRHIGLSPRQFHLITLLSGWATCGNNKTIDSLDEQLFEDGGNVERKEIGLLCKRILDLGRKYYIEKEFGIENVLLKPYIDQSVTLENCALFVY